ncbi:DUF1127 domain-containing protein [Psychromonas algicola]|uniref:DUF1127 domain-containing protein n=1 Tax=Psychromonas algicola TaxID=2555642 RepID=UPI001067DD0C|nr:DUF1127 domain-containing protein [Psychromonas sp. RZ5]TEW48288.1 DUF1127 domain-containing protein [Psychromonas sp. RZ5]
MRPSIYLLLATLFIKADIYNELRKKEKLLRAQRVDIAYLNKHMMQDIGIQSDGFIVGERFPVAVKADRTVRYFRHIEYSKMNT